MHTLRMLGGIGLSRDDGREVDSLLRQPKHIALLAYLALPKPGTWHRRDSILGTFWPEHDQTRARSALRSALYTVRQHLPPGAIASRGDDELSASPDFLRTDVAGMSDDLAAGRFAHAIDRYQGELLPGIYIADAPAFERWLEGERGRARSVARKAATQLSDQLEKRGDLKNAIDAARRAAELDPDDEGAARQWIALLDKSGDRAQAFAVYERFRNHMFEAFGVRPSAETVALLDAVRTRRDVMPVTQHQPQKIQRSEPQRLADPSATAPLSDIRRPDAKSASNRWQWLLLAVPIAAVAVAWIGFRPTGSAKTGAASRSLVVLPMENKTGDPKLAYLASGIADGVARKLEGIGGLTIRSGARSDWTEKTKHDFRAISREFGSTILLRTSITKASDSLELRASVVDAETSEERSLAPRRFSLEGIREVESALAADVAAAVFRTALPAPSQQQAHPIHPESYRLTLDGYHQLLSNIYSSAPSAPGMPGGNQSRRAIVAGRLFQQAIDLDPSNARAWSGLSSVWGARTTSDAVPFDEGVDRASAAAMRALALDSLQGTALANLGIVRALKYRDLSAGLELIRKAERAEPSNPEVFLVKSVLLRSAHLYDQARDAIRFARRLDPLTPYYLDREAIIEFCTDRPQNALELYKAELTMNSTDVLAQAGMARSLALLGRYDEALEWWKRQALSLADTALVKRISASKGKNGYWNLKHALGLKRLQALRSSSEHVSPLSVMQASFASGDSAAGFRALEETERLGIRALYRLPCMPDIDEFRHTPRFVATVARIGPLMPQTNQKR